MNARELLRDGDLDGCLAALKNEIRTSPSDAKLRVFLFQLMSVLGDWDRAMTQLNVAADLDPGCLLMAQVCRQLLNIEVFRNEVFAGKRNPLIFGEPAEWIGWMVQANRLLADGQGSAAADLRDQAFDAAPMVAGTVDGTAFAWIADADTRLGPLLEVVVEGRYYWVPYSSIKLIRIEKPEDLRDVVWIPADFVWSNGGQTSGFIPSRYADSSSHPDPAVRLGRSTVWAEDADGNARGLGQRMLATAEAEYPLLEVREIVLG